MQTPTVVAAAAPRAYQVDLAMTQKLITAGLQGQIVNVWVGKISPILEDSMVKRLLEVGAIFHYSHRSVVWTFARMGAC